MSLGGLEGLTSVGENVEIGWNEALTSLDGLSGLSTVGGLVSINNNPSLPTCEAVTLVERLGAFSGGVCIVNNLADECPEDPSGC